MNTYQTVYRLPEEGELGWQVHMTWEEFTERRLGWFHGPQRARDIMRGRDPATEADIAAWNALGREKAA